MLYLAGMALNDLADREEDARERPERPIPSGAVSPRAAALIGGSLLLGGVLAARARRCAMDRSRARRDDRRLRLPAQALRDARPDRDGRVPRALAAHGRRGVARRGDATRRRGRAAARRVRGRAHADRARRDRHGAHDRAAQRVRGLVAGALLATAVRGGPSSLAWSAATAALAGPAVRRAVVEPSPRTVGPAVGALIRAIPALDGGIAGASGPVPAGRATLPARPDALGPHAHSDHVAVAGWVRVVTHHPPLTTHALN